jgi:hypothetical protein
MEAAKVPHLRVIDSHGEVTEVCEHCVAKDQAIERLTRSYEGTVQRLRQELENEQGQEPQARDVEAVLERWADLATTTGWWTRRPMFKPGDGRWKATRAALNKKFPRSYLLMVVEGAFLHGEQERRKKKNGGRSSFKRQYLEPMTIFGDWMHTYYENATDTPPDLHRVKAAYEAPTVLWDRWPEVLDLARPCDCGHLCLDHQKPALTVDDHLTFGECLVHGCHCVGFEFDWFRDERVARWMEGQT